MRLCLYTSKACLCDCFATKVRLIDPHVPTTSSHPLRAYNRDLATTNSDFHVIARFVLFDLNILYSSSVTLQTTQAVVGEFPCTCTRWIVVSLKLNFSYIVRRKRTDTVLQYCVVHAPVRTSPINFFPLLSSRITTFLLLLFTSYFFILE